METKSVKKTAEEFNSNRKYISQILKSMGIAQEEIIKNSIKSGEIKVKQYDKEGNYIKTFESITEAGESIWDGKSDFKGMKSHISHVCKGKRKSAYGYIWRYEEES